MRIVRGSQQQPLPSTHSAWCCTFHGFMGILFWQTRPQNMAQKRRCMIYYFRLRGSPVRKKTASAGNHVNLSTKNMQLYDILRALIYGRKRENMLYFSRAGPGEHLLAGTYSVKNMPTGHQLQHGEITSTTTQSTT